MRVTMLGCGGSGGVPLANGCWGRCDPANARNRRRRPSILVEHDDVTLLVDTGPDLRAQLLDAGCRRLDAVLYTHAHADHLHGIDDIRALAVGPGSRAIEAFGTPETLDEILSRFAYAFQRTGPSGSLYPPLMQARPIEGPFQVGGLEILPFRQDHGTCTSTGYRFGRFAYSTDVVRLDEEAFAALSGVEVWIVGCLRVAPHPTHAHLARVLEWVDRLVPKRTIFTHMNQTLDYDELTAQLPAGIEPGHDGLVIELSA